MDVCEQDMPHNSCALTVICTVAVLCQIPVDIARGTKLKPRTEKKSLCDNRQHAHGKETLDAYLQGQRNTC